nr:MAG TPA: hypothetical protein [Crassvirales sp.]
MVRTLIVILLVIVVGFLVVTFRIHTLIYMLLLNRLGD